MMEAMRILKTLQLQPRRTVRVVLWTGHEQGGLGTNAYVKQHFQDWVPLFKGNASPAKPEHERFSVIFNMDNGTGKIRGIYQQGNEVAGPIFDAWMAPFKEMGMQTVALPRGGGPDHRMFERVGLPGFGFIQDPIEYNTRTHHSSVDVYERLQAEDLRFNSAVVASFAWQAAQRDEKFPRKPPRW
jgi:Zn-dependent M28 family amino/carboxypeptidase